MKPLEILTYFIRQEGTPFLKIGKTGNIFNRFHTIQTGNPFLLEVIYVVEADIETEMHNALACRRVRGEWFFFPDTLFQWANDFIDKLGHELITFRAYRDSLEIDDQFEFS